ncbi:NACHT domain-containing protein [Corallococcus sp. CA049B]|uniref:HEAT repeat domain-containing protein n=1 Tax=Corallococcus sp. CA049B TaxID=2316730 RepID=UPI000EA03DFD|nr:HEAT repeat domain-containing protein [Corallococcus sp. CA049B]RKG89817.1 NACHT domain-containing protein [Corallococcus sp. CA049B]
MTKVFLAHADGEQTEAEKLAKPLQEAGYELVHEGTVLVGESLLREAQKVLHEGGAVVVCATCRAAGSKWIRKISNAARSSSSGHLFVMQMEGAADIEELVLGEQAGAYWEDPEGAVRKLIEAIRKYYPLNSKDSAKALKQRTEVTYRRLALESCDIISLANLPEGDRHIATRKLEVRRLYVPLNVRAEESARTHSGEQDLAALEERFEAARPERFSPLEPQNRFVVGKLLSLARRLVILGDPGAGKSTLLQWIATAYLLRLKRDPDFNSIPAVSTLPDRNWLPILIRCRDLNPKAIGGTLDDMLRHTLRRSEMSEEEADALRIVLREKLARDEAILLIDGLDEISNTAARTRFCEQLTQIQINFPHVAMVVTSRLVGYREMGYHRIGHGFEHVIVDDLLPAEKDDFVQRWCELTEVPERRAAAAEELSRDIHSTDRIERLTSNPMLLTTMALVKRNVGRLPRRRAELYGEAVQVLLNWRQAETDDPLDAREARPQLQYLAYAMCDRGVQRISEDKVLELLRQMRADYPHLHAVHQHKPEQFLALLERRTGILARTGAMKHLGLPVPVYEFRHLTFQEYLAARALVEQCFPGARPGSRAELIAPLAARQASPSEGESDKALRWHEVLRLFVACCPSSEVDAVLRAILEVSPWEDAAVVAPSRAVRAALCLADEPDISLPLAHEIMDRLGKLIGPQEDFTGSPEAFSELCTSRWCDQARSVLAREFLARDFQGRKPVLDILSVCMDMFPNYSLEEQWLMDLAPPVEDTKAVVAAVGMAVSFSHGGGLDAAAPHLLALLECGGAISHAAAYGLYSLYMGHRVRIWGPNSAEAHRLSAVVADPKSDPGAVLHTIVLLGHMRMTRVVDLLIPRLTDPNDDIREAAARAAGPLGDTRPVDLLLQRLEEPVPSIRAAAAHALGMLKVRQALQPLRQKLGDADLGVRFSAVQGLWRLLCISAAPPEDTSALTQELLPLLSDAEGSGFPRFVASLLGWMKSRDAVAPLIAIWRSMEEPTTAWNYYSAPAYLAYALGEIGDPKAAEPLRHGVDRWEPSTQAAIVTAVCKLQGQHAVDWLAALSDHDASAVRLAAVAGLAWLGDSRGKQLLEQALQSDDEGLRVDALGAWVACHGDLDDVDLVTWFIQDHGYPVDLAHAVELSTVELIAEGLGLPLNEVRERFERLSQKLPLKLAWRTA